ncbi:penicillin acylase family protein [Brevibacillus sp. B_LB10_24]|uniref:penicillin acylase family protein n=1 Tax=Brevibacillus sp. B_LB10_24 TaxID=3380645 RepID=UPI0038B7FA3F
MKRFILSILAGILLLTTPGLASADNGTAALTEYRVPGLKNAAEIIVDHWGVPHIYASSQEDAFFVQGFNAARDRLWQIDLWRRRGLGQLSEVLGPAYVEQDRAARLFLYRGDMKKEWAAYGSDTQKIVTAFVNGINAYVDKALADPELIPEEFRILGYKPAKWSPEDIVRIRSHGLTRNLKSEVARAQIVSQFGGDVESIRQRLEPEWKMEIPEGVDYADIPKDVLKVYDLATQGVEFDQATKTLTQTSLAEELYEQANIGSNNWVVSGARTETGRPILANDPHRTLSLPSLRYIAHLSAPGMDVIGAGEPILPGISIGHNGKIAFGLTIFAIDQEDLYVYETNPKNPSEYRYKGKWVPMKEVKESVPVLDGQAQEVKLEYTTHGPVIYKDTEKNKAYAVRAAWLEPGMAPYLGSSSYMTAANWKEFSKAMNQWGSPSENQVYADTQGNIGWKPGGLTPVRKNWDGLLPVPGDGRYEWNGFLNQEKLPSEFNPARGYIGTANQMNLPKDYRFEQYKLGFEWATPFRFNRIDEVLGKNGKMSVQDALRLQTDYQSEPAKRIQPLLANLQPNNEKQKQALQLLKNWDVQLSPDSAAAALFEVWYQQHVRPAMVAKLVPAEAKQLIGAGDPVVILNLVEKPDQRLGDHPAQVRDELLLTTLDEAIKNMENLLGTDMTKWKWGDLHHAELKHPLAALVDEQTASKMNIAQLPRGGSADTVGNTSYSSGDFRQISGASFRMVIDVGNWDESVAVNSPGQSGDYRDPHYQDLFPLWAGDKAFPLLYSREKIEQAAEKKFVLTPGN